MRRYDLDAALAKRFVELGGELRCPFRFQGKAPNEGDVLATGRRLETHHKWKWYGLKAHATNVEQQSDLELHFIDNGYIGLCRVGANTTNICGLFRRSKEGEARTCTFLEHFTGVTTLRDRLKNVAWDESSFASVSGLPMEEGGNLSSENLAVGDALSMMPPFTGKAGVSRLCGAPAGGLFQRGAFLERSSIDLQTTGSTDLSTANLDRGVSAEGAHESRMQELAHARGRFYSVLAADLRGYSLSGVMGEL